MKTFLIALALALPLALTGCPASTSPTPLAPGYINTADQQMGQILSGAHAFYQKIQQQSASGQMVLTSAQKQAFNDFGVGINAAQTIYLSYHAGTASQAQAQTDRKSV